MIMERALNTYVLGEHVAPQWSLGKVLKWRPMNVGSFSVPLGPDVDTPSPLVGLSSDNARGVGLYKVLGTTVEAVAGGVFHQFVRLYASAVSTVQILTLLAAGVSRAVQPRTGSSIREYYRD